ncbi:hypothetical protein [Desulfitobacterium sp.]|uniref:hypothetical protein n=1 Tax=Desulfitobacterium sp. TaxID=49981 RepID=UPI002D135035|nr:hypothetical protein [Desulfitobacterium sp.]HVJ49890.1 hypothetical protein [Desulfitobacterium sp.]
MTEREEQIVKAIWRSAVDERSKFCRIEHAQNGLRQDDSIIIGRILLQNKTQKRVS